MAAPTTYIQEFEQEMPITRRVLERVPGDKATWKPHEKSFRDRPFGATGRLDARLD
jgi:hypothetical protein